VTEPNDRDLRDVFAGARERDRARAPRFERVLAGRPRSRRTAGLRLGPLVVAAAAAALSLGVWWGAQSRGRPSGPFQFRPGELRTPTDFLLDLTSTEYLRAIPRIGRVDGLDLMTPPAEGSRDTADRSKES
jgi:hypothetical protein